MYFIVQPYKHITSEYIMVYEKIFKYLIKNFKRIFFLLYIIIDKKRTFYF